MSATYNWAYRPGVANKYNLNIPAGGDGDRWSTIGIAYVAMFGNDSTGNGSRLYPYRTPAGANSAGANNMIFAPGIYRGVGRVGNAAYADGDVIFDNSILGDTQALRLYGVKFLDSHGTSVYDSTYSDIQSASTIQVQVPSDFQYNIVKGLGGIIIQYDYALNLTQAGNNTFIDSDISIRCGSNQTSVVYCNAGYFSIFDNCRISFTDSGTISVLDYSMFNNCQFRIGSSGAFTSINNLSDLLAFIYAAYPNNGGYKHCSFGDPLFNNRSLGDYSLAINSAAKNKSYQGTYVGAKSIAQPIQVSATEASGNLDFSTAVNLTINDNSLTIADTTQNSQIDTKLIANPTGRELSKLSVLGFTADRNGQYLSSITDLAATAKTPSDTLSVPTPYLVETGAITYNGNVYQPGDRLTTVTGQTAFTTSSGGTLREILQAPERHTIMARFSNGSGTITAGTALTAGYWYYVESGSVTYNSVTYNSGSSFKAVDTNSFSGTGVVTLALSTESFQHYEPGIQPTSNNTGDTRTGSIIRGNGDPAYVRGGLYVNEFPINARFFQLRFILQVNNLKS